MRRPANISQGRRRIKTGTKIKIKPKQTWCVMRVQRQILVVNVQALGGVDCIRALRGWLKIGLRRFGLRCVPLHPDHKKETEMDIGMFASNWVKPDDVRHEPLVTRIIAVLMNDKRNRPMLELENGMQFTLFERNVDVLIKAWGRNTDDWPGYEVELSYETYSSLPAKPHHRTQMVEPRRCRRRDNSCEMKWMTRFRSF
jgi:hypothetical protein